MTYPLHGKESIKPCGLECLRTKEITATDMSPKERKKKERERERDTHTRKQTERRTWEKINTDTRHTLETNIGTPCTSIVYFSFSLNL